MKAKSYTVNISGDMTNGDWLNELEKVVAAAHKLIEAGLILDKPANQPDLGNLYMAAQQLNVALTMGQMIDKGVMPTGADAVKVPGSGGPQRLQ